MNENNKTENKDIYLVETEYKSERPIKELIKELMLNAHIETDTEIWYNEPII